MWSIPSTESVVFMNITDNQVLLECVPNFSEGRNLAVVDMPKPKLHFGGLLAWMIWMGLHLMLILGVKNRFFVFMNWLYNYITYDQNLRLIFREFYKETSNTKKQGS